DRRTEVVDERDARLDEDLRTHVRVAPRRRAGGVEHGGGSDRGERLGGDSVDVDVVDHRHLARLQTLRQRLGRGVDTHAPERGVLRLADALTSVQQRGHRRYRRTSARSGRSSSSAACRSAVSESSPESMRASSRSRSSPVTACTVVATPSSSDERLTTRWVSANAATCARWVTTTTWV